MKNEKKSYRVQIFGDEYTVISDEPENQVIQAATLIDSLMHEIIQNAQLTDPKKIAVLAALRVASKLLDCEQSLATDNNKKVALVEYIEQELLALEV